MDVKQKDGIKQKTSTKWDIFNMGLELGEWILKNVEVGNWQGTVTRR